MSNSKDGARKVQAELMPAEKPFGRPTSYFPEFCEQLIEHMAEGLSYQSFAGKIGVCSKTLLNWEKVNPDFLRAKQIGTEKSRLAWEKINISNCKYGGGSPTLIALNMMNRFGWNLSKEPPPDESKKEVVVKIAFNPDTA